MKKLTMIAHRVKGAERPARILETFLANEWTHSNESYVITIERSQASCSYCDGEDEDVGKYGCPWHDNQAHPV